MVSHKKPWKWLPTEEELQTKLWRLHLTRAGCGLSHHNPKEIRCNILTRSCRAQTFFCFCGSLEWLKDYFALRVGWKRCVQKKRRVQKKAHTLYGEIFFFNLQQKEYKAFRKHFPYFKGNSKHFAWFQQLSSSTDPLIQWCFTCTVTKIKLTKEKTSILVLHASLGDPPLGTSYCVELP